MNSVFDRQNNQISSIGDVAYIVKHFFAPRNQGSWDGYRRPETEPDGERCRTEVFL